MKQDNTSETFEARIERLQQIVMLMEKGDIPLDQSVALYKEGVQLSKACRQQLEKAKHDIKLMTERGAEEFTEDSNDEISEDF